MLGTSAVTRAVMRFNSAQSSSGTSAFITSTVLMQRMMQGHSYARLPSRTPVARKSGTTAKYCQMVSPALSISSRTIASASRRASRRSRVMAPRQRTPRSGPGKGWRSTMFSGKPSSRPTTRKSMPGAKDLLACALMVGGAFPHCLGLSETVLVFETHLTFILRL